MARKKEATKSVILKKAKWHLCRWSNQPRLRKYRTQLSVKVLSRKTLGIAWIPRIYFARRRKWVGLMIADSNAKFIGITVVDDVVLRIKEEIKKSALSNKKEHIIMAKRLKRATKVQILEAARKTLEKHFPAKQYLGFSFLIVEVSHYDEECGF